MQCKKCGKSISEDSSFCEFCGTKMEAEIVVEGGNLGDPLKYSTFESDNGKVLESPAPFENKLEVFSWGYVIIPVVMVIIGLFIGAKIAGMFLFGLILDILWLFIKNIIADVKIAFGNTIHYNLPVNISAEELSAIITQPLAQINMHLERKGDLLTIRYDKVFFDVFIRNQDGIFSILPYQSFGSNLIFGKRNITLYRKSTSALPLIIFTIQNELRGYCAGK